MVLVGRLTPPHLFLPLTAGSRFKPKRLPSLTHLASSRRLSYSTFAAATAVDTFSQKSGYLFELSDSEAESMLDYDIAKIAAIYRRKPLILIRRLFQIGTTLGRWFALRYIDSLMERGDIMFKIRAVELRMILVELGPAYVKIAQAVSSRPDLISPSYVEELSLLQDQIAPFSNEVAFSTMEEELGLAMDELFLEITPVPVAAASLGQVYQAKLYPSGQMVAVKVQRPGVQAAISLDILLMRFLAGVIRRTGKFNTDLQAVVDEWASNLFREMDYRKEAENGVKFRELYGGLQDVFVPQMYVEETTRKVLIMEWVEGQKLSEVKDLRLVEVGVYCSFNQLLEYGFYHADPHPGNLLRTYDGKLAYLDFGMMGEFNQELRDGFIEACLHLVNRDFDALARDFVTLGLLPSTADREAVTVALTGVFQNAVTKGVRNISFGDLLGDLGITMYKFKFRIPSYFFLVIRSLAVLEGIAISFNPDYKVLGSTYPWIARKVLTDSSPKLRTSLRDLLYTEGVFRIDRLESLLTESLRATTDKSLVKKQAQDSRIVTKEILSFMLSEKGSFVRDILIEETAKGLDALGLATVNSITSTAAAFLPFPASIPIFPMTEEDITNLRSLLQLMQLMSGLQDNENLHKSAGKIIPYKNQTLDSRDIAQVLNQLTSIQEVMPILSALIELPPEKQQQFYSLPADLTARLLSRMAARSVRRYFVTGTQDN
ncbi:hypothetical protein Nepgr_033456 [Nepenthes gracilis]|uniref:ABC1 atypical kinase-like domain-containing protein n=1 Tax=Nepenthes gracilis TaxID=150966 RepID=A0AAD3TLG8_NEPGR|nr:hypothetical protein Nepgr_033456 [Nepenthes gracilis]